MLRIFGRRPDGFHEVATILQSISLCDELTFELREDGEISLTCDDPEIPVDESNLIVRAADVILKERRKLVLMVRESPFHLGHLRSMAALAEMGAIVAPPIPGFYHRPQTIEDLVDHSVDRVLDLIGLAAPGARRWDGPERSQSRDRDGANE